MNKEFVKKMIQIKKLEYEAIKEILPEGLKDKVESFEGELITLVKEVAIELMKEETSEGKIEKKARKINIS